jgi:putative aldouronate transport system permease protein
MQQPLVEKATPPTPQEAQKLSTTRRANMKRVWDKNSTLFFMALPGLLLVFVFSYLPMFGIIVAFKDYKAVKGLFDSDWIGLKNFEFLFGTQDAWHVTFNTLFLNSLFIITSTLGAIGLALLLNEVRERFKIMTNFYQSALLLPHFISYVIVSYFVFAFLNTDNGLVNHTLAGFGLDTISWYSSPQYWPAILTSVNLWKSVGFASIIYLSGILAINPEYYEAAKIDGATKWQQISKITVPLIMPLIIIMVLLSIGRIFYADFGLFYQVTRDNGLLYSTTDVLDTYVYRALRVNGDVGMSAAAGLYQALVGFVLVVLANWTVRRIDPDKALF